MLRTSARAAIDADRLLWAGQNEDVNDLDEQGVYLFDNLADSRRFGSFFHENGYDIWLVVLDPDDELCIEEDPLEQGGWMVPTEHAVEPLELSLLESGTADSIR